MIEKLEQDLFAGETASTLCGGRQYSRKFSKKDYPILGDPDEIEENDSEVIVLSQRSKERLPKKLSTSVRDIIDLCLDPKTKRWHWPKNGADLVFPQIYLGDE